MLMQPGLRREKLFFCFPISIGLTWYSLICIYSALLLIINAVHYQTFIENGEKNCSIVVQT